MSYRIALNFEDGVTRFIDCKPGEKVADAAYRQGVNVPIDCRDGACGACKCHAESGTYTHGFYIEDALSEEEAALGHVLTCQMVPTSDCVVGVPASSAVCKVKPSRLTARLAAVERLSDSTLSVTLEGADIDKLSFLPGQYANLQVPGTEFSRAYSFSSMPVDGQVSFLIRNVPNGQMSGYLTQRARPGDEITLAGPLGSFYLREVSRPLLFIAGGTGLAPFTAMLDKLVAEGGTSQPIHLFYGVNTDSDVVGLERLDAFKAALPTFTYTVVVVDEGSRHPCKGYITRHIEPAHLFDGELDIYLCGPPPMVEAVAHNLRERGVEARGFHYEKFSSSH